jgi:hypothetical protein
LRIPGYPTKKGESMDKKGKRVYQLKDLGLKFNSKEMFMTMDDINVHWTEITCDTDDEWNKKIKKIKAEIKRREETKIS